MWVIVTEATNGIIPIEKWKERHFDLLLFDFEIPEMNGK